MRTSERALGRGLGDQGAEFGAGSGPVPPACQSLGSCDRDLGGFAFGEDFGAPHEATLGDHFRKPVFVEYFPASMKPFYMKRDPGDPTRVLAADLIAPEGYGELIGGSQRVDTLDELTAQLEEKGLPRKPYEWYLDLRRYGSVPHSGFGLGMARTIAWVCGIPHIRETIPFPRQLNRLYP